MVVAATVIDSGAVDEGRARVGHLRAGAGAWAFPGCAILCAGLGSVRLASSKFLDASAANPAGSRWVAHERQRYLVCLTGEP
jgi:hypothetical protein